MTGWGGAAVLCAAGLVAGVIGTAGGITSLVSYPALLPVGIAPLRADVANLIAALGCWPGSAMASRPELRGRGRWLGRWAPVVMLGGVSGSVLLLTTPPGVFVGVVPFLVMGAALALAAQPRLAGRRPGPGPLPGLVPGPVRLRRRGTLLAGLLATSLYGGYFGAGSGVMTLALLLAAADDDLPRANALKNVFLGAAALMSALLFALLGPVDWAATASLGAGMFAGSLLGPRLVRRAPTWLLRWAVVLMGVGLAARLWAGQVLCHHPT